MTVKIFCKSRQDQHSSRPKFFYIYITRFSNLILLNLIVHKAANIPLKEAKLSTAGSLIIVLNLKEANLDRGKYYCRSVKVKQFVK